MAKPDLKGPLSASYILRKTVAESEYGSSSYKTVFDGNKMLVFGGETLDILDTGKNSTFFKGKNAG